MQHEREFRPSFIILNPPPCLCHDIPDRIASADLKGTAVQCTRKNQQRSAFTLFHRTIIHA